MKKRLRPLPVRVRLVLSLVLLVLTFFLAWWASGWAWPTRGLAYRALETAHGFGPGEIVAQGEISFEKGYSNQSGADYSAWMAGRDYIIPEDIRLLYYNALEHRIVPDPQARLSGRTPHALLAEVWESVPSPKAVG